MAGVALTQITSMGTLVSATNVTSADTSYTVSGVLDDGDLNIVFVNGASSSLVATIDKGGYANGDSSTSGTDTTTLPTIAASTVRVIAGIDGSKYRSTAGNVAMNLALTGAGSCNIYAFSKKYGM
jgi:hypothetical protein